MYLLSMMPVAAKPTPIAAGKMQIRTFAMDGYTTNVYKIYP